jgi:hypothetical protein
MFGFTPEQRSPVGRTLQDLQAVAGRFPNYGHQRERYDNAFRHLSEFDRQLRNTGRFDKGILDAAIGDVQNVADHNNMDWRARRVLNHDADDLRRLRQHYDDRRWRNW